MKIKKELQAKERGITLIALVITIIVLLILAGVSIAMLTGENGILTQAQNAKEGTEQAGDIEKIRLAISEAQIGESGYQELNFQSFQKALNSQFGEDNAIVSIEDDGTYTVSCLNSLKDYTVSGNNIEQVIDWNEKMTSAVAPESQDEERNNGVIGIGTDGNPIDMDLWEYNFDNTTGGYGLNDETSLVTTASADASKGYLGNNFNNIVIPQYISIDNGKTWDKVTNLDWTFYNCSELKQINKLPTTIKSMRYTFRECINLEQDIFLPGSVQNLYATFYNCSSLKNVSDIPNGATDLGSTFYGCISLVEAPEITDGVIIMDRTFYGCTSLEKAPSIIPSTVMNLYNTFRNCNNLCGEIIIEASISGKILDNGYLDYVNCFRDATTEDGIELVLKCSSSVYDLFFDSNQSNSINGNLCQKNSNIKILMVN